jgi:hypothetical protein
VAESSIKAAAASGITSLAGDLEDSPVCRRRTDASCPLPPWSGPSPSAVFRTHEVRSILAARAGVARPTAAGEALVLALPVIPTRPLSDYAIGESS